MPLWDNGTPPALRAGPSGLPVRFRAAASDILFKAVDVVYKLKEITTTMAEGNNKLKLVNSKRKLMRIELPELKLGEGIDKLIPFISKDSLKKEEEFYEELRKDGLTEQNIQDKYRSCLLVLSYVINMDLHKAKREDCRNLNAWISNSKYQYYRRENLRIALKKIFRFWKATGTHNPEEVWDVSRPRNEKKPKPQKPKRLVKTNEEVDDIIKAVGNNRDKLFLALLWNTAGRPIEIEKCKFSQIYEYNGQLILDLKTAKESGDEDDRKIVLIYALPYYHRWKAEFKEIFNIKGDDDLTDMYIFRKFPAYDKDKLKNIDKNKSVCHAYYSNLFNEIGKKLSIPQFTPKIFRKWSISRWERQGVPYALIKKMSGHSKNSRAIEHYSFHDEEDCYSHLLKLEGVEKEKEIIKELPPIIKCKRCNKENKSQNEYCEFCGFGLTEEAIIKQQLKKDNQINDLKKAMKEELENMYTELIKEKLKR